MANLKYSDKHNMVAFLKKPNGSDDFHEIVDFLKCTPLRYSLTHNPTIFDSLVKQFWQTATVRTIANGNQELLATIDSKVYTITEASIRTSLQLADATCITNLPDSEIHEGLATMGYVSDGILTFWKKHFTPQWKFLIHTILHCLSPKSGGWDQFSSNIDTALIYLSSNRVYNFSKLIFNGQHIAPVLTKKIFGNMKRGFEGNHVPLLPAMLAPAQADEATTTSVEVDAEGDATTTASLEAGLDNGNIHESLLRSHDAPLPEVNTSGSAKDSVQLKELMELVPKLVLRIDSLEKELTMTTQLFGNEVLTLKNRVKTLEVALKRKLKKVVLSESKREEADNSSKQGRKSQDNRSKDFITPSNSGEAQEQDNSPTLLDVANTLTQVAFGGISTYKRRKRYVDTGMDYFSAAKERTKSEEVNTDWDVIRVKLEANAELVKNMQGEGPSEEDFAKRMVDMINQRKKYFAEERTKAKRRTSKKQKTVDDSGSAELQEKVAAKDVQVTEEKAGETTVSNEEEEDSDTDKEEGMEENGAIHVATKSPSVVNWKIFQQELYRLVMQKYRANRPEDVYDRVLWSDLRTMFEPLTF
ncbi:hypothetical protein Tco_1541154 [Tanacetum coccineum]